LSFAREIGGSYFRRGNSLNANVMQTRGTTADSLRFSELQSVDKTEEVSRSFVTVAVMERKHQWDREGDVALTRAH